MKNGIEEEASYSWTYSTRYTGGRRGDFDNFSIPEFG
jgi:hypothetical protein